TGAVSDLLLRWEQARQQGDALSPQELCRDHPELLFEVSNRVRQLEAAYGARDLLQSTVLSGPEMAPTMQGPPREPGYEILPTLGRGGMGVAYKARQTTLNRLVALKMVLAGAHTPPVARLRFQIEAEAIASLQHPHIVQVYEVGEVDSCPYLAMEYLD